MMPTRPFSAAAFFVLRTPSLPYDFQAAWSVNLQASNALPGALEPAAEADREALRRRLRGAVLRPDIREALYVASPDLEASLEAWVQGALTPERAQRVEQSLVRYLTRMSSRCTPFGLFAGCSLGAWGADTRLAVPEWRYCQRRTRLDMHYLEALVEALGRDPAVRSAQTYRPNSSLYLAAGRWRYAEARLGVGTGRDYHLVALEPTGHLESTLKRAGAGADLASLAGALVPGTANAVQAGAFIGELVDAQVLTGGLFPPLTGTEALPAVVERLRADARTHDQGQALGAVQEALDRMDEHGPGLDPQRYRDLAGTLAAQPVPVDPKHLFQVDLYKPAPGLTLGPQVREVLEAGVDLLRRLSPPRPPGPLERFKDAFRERYEGRRVPLLEALDAEAGIGFGPGQPPGLEGAPLLEELDFPNPDHPRVRTFTDRDAHLLKGIQRLGPGQDWALSDVDVAALENPDAPPFPDAFSALAALAAPSAQALADGEFQVWLEHYSGPSGARLLGRFCQLDAGLEDRVRAHLAAEEALRPGLVFAEVVHLPDGRTGNILSRPRFRSYEIPLLGVSGAPAAEQILVQDLTVALEGDRIVLRSTRLGQEVLPRLTSAHNYSRGLPVYRFLGALQDQEGGAGGWSWGCLAGLPFLPRVTRGRQVLTRARWRLEAWELQAVLKGKGSGAFLAFQVLRESRGLPRFVVLEDGDNGLWLDLDHPLRVETLLHLVAQRSSCTLREVFPGPDQLVAEGPEGRFCHELVVPFERQEAHAPARNQELQDPSDPPQRTFPPGSEWLYVKLYTGLATADRVLLERVGPLLESTRGVWDQWFFLRYADPGPHLRLRFHGSPDQLLGILLPSLHEALAPLLQKGLGWRLQVDTYEQEVERYGGPEGMRLAEAWFSVDSANVLDQLRECLGDAGAHLRWRLALKGVDGILTDLGFDLAGKLRVVSRVRDALAQEFQAQNGLEVQLGARFRTLRSELETWVTRTSTNPRDLLVSKQKACLDQVRQASASGQLTRPLEDLASSYAHMHVNRLLRSSQRAHEFVLMDFLARLYESWLARRRSGDH